MWVCFCFFPPPIISGVRTSRHYYTTYKRPAATTTLAGFAIAEEDDRPEVVPGVRVVAPAHRLLQALPLGLAVDAASHPPRPLLLPPPGDENTACCPPVDPTRPTRTWAHAHTRRGLLNFCERDKFRSLNRQRNASLEHHVNVTVFIFH